MPRNPNQNEMPGMVYKKNVDKAIDFLEQFCPSGPWHLMAIPLDKKGGINAKTFDHNQRCEMRAWLEQKNGNDNLYFQVNKLADDIRNVKAKKEHIVEVPYLHVDIDHENALEGIKAFEKKPTVTVWSGNGVHAYWKLTTALADIERAERCNRALEEELNADHCHNVDRILRLAFTTNLPDARKRQKGRVEAESYIIDELTDWDRVYDIECFKEDESSIKSQTTVANAVTITATAKVEDLPEQVSEYTRQLIIHGYDPENPRNSKNPTYASRSEPVFKSCCDLVRAGVDDAVICGILLNPNYGISESIREKKDAFGYARKQVTSARHAISDSWPEVSKGGKPKKCYENAVVALHKLNLNFQFDLFRSRLIVNGHAVQEFSGEITDNACAYLRSVVIEQFGFDAGKVNIQDAVHALCIDNCFHPIKDYLRTLVWDGKPRLDTMLIQYFTAEDNPLNRAISRLMMVAAVKRIMHPGTKFDTIVVLEGYQGSGKSSALRILAGDENFCDQDILSLDTKSQIEVMEGVWIYEIGELEGLRRNEVGKVKAFASRISDKARAAYARYSERRPRQNIFVGTTNDDQYLKDETGNRRFLPVRTGSIDLEALTYDRDQLWAEAVVYEARGESIALHESLWGAAAKEQDMRMEYDSWEGILADVRGDVHHGYYRISTHELLSKVIGIDPERQQRHHTTRLSTLMKKLGWAGPKSIVIDNGQRVKGYEKPAPMDEEPI